MATLDDVINHYAAGGKVNHPNKSPLMRAFSLTERDRTDLIEFLRSLTDETVAHDSRWSDPWPR